MAARRLPRARLRPPVALLWPVVVAPRARPEPCETAIQEPACAEKRGSVSDENSPQQRSRRTLRCPLREGFCLLQCTRTSQGKPLGRSQFWILPFLVTE